MPIFDALMKYCDKILDTCALDHHEVLDEEPILSVPPSMKNSGGWVEQISQLLIINLQERCFDIKLLVS